MRPSQGFVVLELGCGCLNSRYKASVTPPSRARRSFLKWFDIRKAISINVQISFADEGKKEAQKRRRKTIKIPNERRQKNHAFSQIESTVGANSGALMSTEKKPRHVQNRCSDSTETVLGILRKQISRKAESKIVVRT